MTRRVILGRQRSKEPAPPCHARMADADRIIVASKTDTTVSRRHVRLEIADGGVQATNLSSVRPVVVEPGGELLPTEISWLPSRATIRLGPVTVEVASCQGFGAECFALSALRRLHVGVPQVSVSSDSLLQACERDPALADVVLPWLGNAINVFADWQISPPGPADVASAVIAVAGFEDAVLLNFSTRNGWRACHGEARSVHVIRSDGCLLSRVLSSRRTIIMHRATEGMTIVASPFQSRPGEVRGALGAIRSYPAAAGLSKMARFQASVVELIASQYARRGFDSEPHGSE